MAPIPLPHEPSWPIPKLSLHVEDLAHPGASIFFESTQPMNALREAVIASLKWLYTPETAPINVEYIRLVLRPMDGVAYTHGDVHKKEVHFSLDHIKNSAILARDEILGVLTHEVVHCYQYDARGTCPGGLIEGIAGEYIRSRRAQRMLITLHISHLKCSDFVRLKAGLVPPHWKRTGGDKWDAGYQTTAYFLDWLEERHGKGTVQKLNASMNDAEYDEHIFEEITGTRVESLWQFYCTHLEG